MNNYITGLVIKEESHGENAKLLMVLTPDKGILRMKAPGAKNLKSSTHSAVQLFTYSEFSIAKGRNGYITITGAKVKENFFGLRNDVLKYALACYFSSAVMRVTPNDLTSEPILRLVLNCLYALSQLEYSTETVKPFFEIKLASICGFTPDFDQCPSCGERNDTVIFDFFNSGFLCEKCCLDFGLMIKSQRFFQLSQNNIKAFRFLSICDMKKMFQISSLLSSQTDQKQFRDFAEIYICNIFESLPKTLTFYNHLMRSIYDEKLRQKQENT